MITSLFLFGSLGIILKALIVVCLVALYFQAKVTPIKDRLDAKHRGYYDKIDNLLGGLGRSLGKSMKPYQVGEGVFIDMGQFVLFLIFAFLALAMMMGL
jgi:hypothetical protein